MNKAVNPIPEGYNSVTPYLYISDCAAAIDFYTKVFGATESERMEMPDGRIGHTEIKIGDSIIMMADEFPEFTNLSPSTVGGTTVGMHLYLENVDDVFASAIAEGATVMEEPEDKFYGDRSGRFLDPFGHHWSVATHAEDVSPELMNERMQAMFAQAPD